MCRIELTRNKTHVKGETMILKPWEKVTIGRKTYRGGDEIPDKDYFKKNQPYTKVTRDDDIEVNIDEEIITNIESEVKDVDISIDG
jgi:hypothetical protein